MGEAQSCQVLELKIRFFSITAAIFFLFLNSYKNLYNLARWAISASTSSRGLPYLRRES